MTTIAVIALDMDGTLLSSDHEVTEKTAVAIQQARNKGIKVILVTGRHHMMAYPVHQQLALDTPLICANGAYVFDANKQQITHGMPMTSAQWQQLIPLIESFNLSAICHFSSGIGHQPNNKLVNRVMKMARGLPSHLRPCFIEQRSMAELCHTQTPLWKIELSHASASVVDNFITALPNDLAITYDRTAPNGLEIVNEGNSKGNRLAEWAAQEGLRLDQIIAFGDNHNDVSMFQKVGLGIAMGNAPAEIQAQAHFVTGSNDNDGIVAALQRWVL
jgi:Cof subfamily protein (haloacid dehalogenase superfamily)